MKNGKIISLSTAKAKQIQRKSRAVHSLTTEQVLTAFHEVVMSPHVFLQGIVNNLVPYVKMEFLDVDGLRGFLIDVINCIHNDDEMLQEWITDHMMEYNEDPRAAGLLFPVESRTREELFSEAAYNIVTGAANRDEVVKFSAGVLWVINGDYTHGKALSVDDFIVGAITINYDFNAEYKRTLEDSLFLCPAGFVDRMMNDTWYFAAIMADGGVVEFENLDAVVDNNGLCANILACSDPLVTDEDVQEYGKKVIANNQMSIQVKNTVLRNASDGSVWMDADMVEGSAYNICRTRVSINVRHISCSRESAEEEGVTILDFDIKSLTMKKDHGRVLRLCDAVMFFETADT